jgi:putative PIN family toxin of toxin-antitoxin system
MVVTMDTSVLFQALSSSSGASHAIFRRIRGGSIRLALSVPVYGEYQDVLSRPDKRTQLGLSVDDARAVLNFIAFIAVPSPVHFRMRPNLRDESDNIFVELAFASGSSYLITQNVRDFTVDADLNLGQLRIVTPSHFMKNWRQTHGNEA